MRASHGRQISERQVVRQHPHVGGVWMHKVLETRDPLLAPHQYLSEVVWAQHLLLRCTPR